MSCVPCTAEGEGASIPLEEFDRWTDTLHHVLESRDARRYFREFLCTRGLQESEDALEFWERCDHLRRTSVHRHSPHSGHHKSSHIGHMRFVKEASDLVTLAEDKLNFDLAQMRSLYEAVESGKEEVIKPVLKEAMKSAQETMEDDYQLYRKHLLKQRGMPKKS